MATATAHITTEELLAMPEDGMNRWLIRGELREKPMTIRNRFHSKVMARISTILNIWRDEQPEPRGDVLVGEAGVRLPSDPETTVGVDVVYLSASVASSQSEESTIIEGIPTLVVEILSPSNTQEELHEKISVYLEVGVPLIWIVDPYDHTVKIYRPGTEPEMVNVRQELSADPILPGFRVPVAKLFS